MPRGEADSRCAKECAVSRRFRRCGDGPILGIKVFEVDVVGGVASESDLGKCIAKVCASLSDEQKILSIVPIVNF